MTQIDAFIPLKGHSARVPGKNLRDFDGKPLFLSIVEQLQAATRVGTIFIDTDSPEIAERASPLDGVVVMHRRPELVGDDVSVNLLIKSFLETYPSKSLIQTHATNPLLTARTIDAALAEFEIRSDISSLFSVTRFQARFFDADMRAINHNPNELLPTQNLSPLYLENSNFYIFDREGFLEDDRRITDRAAMFEVDPNEAVDIDEESDFELALSILRSGKTNR
ncbi:MAG: cytidylyltransferase domain-containing protein [Acidimicrobiia bacterium]